MVLLSATFVKLFCSLANNTRLLVQPNERTLHAKPTVRGSGIVFIGLWLLSVSFLGLVIDTPFSQQMMLILSGLLLSAISFLDDLMNLSVKIRLLVQALVSFSLTFYLFPLPLNFLLFTVPEGIVASVFVVAAFIWAINHFNFMDGLDGFAAIQAFFLLSIYSLIFNHHQAIFYEYVCLMLVASLVGFLIFNFPPAKVFMGDVGSATLGLSTFLMGLVAQKYYSVPIIYWFMLNGLFLFDATITLLRRIVNRETWYAPHKKHAYQRIKQLGVNSELILSGQVVINAVIVGLVACIYFYPQYTLAIVALELVGLSGIYVLIERAYPMTSLQKIA
ncbi:putative undecaprenyl-phosphate N-acetylglucosaminyl 1-phosphate transferase [Legionella clemsonensis]|uniref:Putative undecaprenyl-phosphate N-acetylglucosaminyl 1-phosphate transferase n=2 Tax=Legionella clemsonensis TaxID=1867846 RepID=A0A222P3T4_9GAMM|nr:putative undecaprenyl-phosphate N-acetylglucosaminyl 1-phosphate transferase [Legionella clemsonensis]